MAETARQEADFILDTTDGTGPVFMIHGERFPGDPTLFYYLGDVDLDPGTAWKNAGPVEAAACILATGADWVYLGRTDTYTEEFAGFVSSLDELLPVEAVYQSGDYSYLLKLTRTQ